MVEAVRGEKKVLYLRLLEERATKAGAHLALQVSHTIKEERSVETTQTKDGGVAQSGGYTVSIDMEFLESRDDVVYNMLHYAMQENKTVEVWEVNLDRKNSEGKYEALYGTGLLGTWETEASVEGNSSITTTLTMNGRLVLGYETIQDGDVALVLKYHAMAKGGAESEPKPIYTPETTVGG